MVAVVVVVVAVAVAATVAAAIVVVVEHADYTKTYPWLDAKGYKVKLILRWLGAALNKHVRRLERQAPPVEDLEVAKLMCACVFSLNSLVHMLDHMGPHPTESGAKSTGMSGERFLRSYQTLSVFFQQGPPAVQDSAKNTLFDPHHL